MPKSFKIVLIIILLSLSSNLKAQEELGIYACGFTLHVGGDPNAQLMPLRLDEKGRYLLNYGIVFHYKNYLTDRLSFDVIQTAQADCAQLPSFGSNVSIGCDILQLKGHRLIIAMGPGIYLRKSWKQFPEYQLVQDFKYSKNNKWEYMIIPVVPHLEYAFRKESKRFGFRCYGIVDPIDHVYNFGMGITYLLKDNPHLASKEKNNILSFWKNKKKLDNNHPIQN